MKRIAYSFLLIAVLSCGSHIASEENRIRVQVRDSTMQDLFLLAVRNDALVVSPYKTFDVPMDSLIAHAYTIPFAKAEALAYKGERSTSLLPGLGGCLIGGIGGCVIGANSMKQEGDFILPLGGGVGGGFIGFAGGMILAHVLGHDPDYKWVLDIKSNIDQLRQVAIYSDQAPPELQKIK